MRAFLQFSLVAGISLAAAGATWLVKGSPSASPGRAITCDPSAVKSDEICPADVPENAVWIDARLRSEWEADGLKGALLWNLDPAEEQAAFEATVATGIVSSQPSVVVVYCGSEACGTSRQIAGRVRSLELGPDVRVLHGGWDALRLRGSSSAR